MAKEIRIRIYVVHRTTAKEHEVAMVETLEKGIEVLNALEVQYELELDARPQAHLADLSEDDLLHWFDGDIYADTPDTVYWLNPEGEWEIF